MRILLFWFAINYNNDLKINRHIINKNSKCLPRLIWQSDLLAQFFQLRLRCKIQLGILRRATDVQVRLKMELLLEKTPNLQAVKSELAAVKTPPI